MGALSIKDRIAARRGAIAANRSKGLRPYKFKNGKTKFRILPWENPESTNESVLGWDRRFGMHFLKSFDGQNKFAIGDRELTYGQSDPIRELIFDAMRQASSDEDTRKHYRDMLGSPRVVFNALILDDKDQPATDPVLLEVSETAFDNILAQFEAYTDMDPEYDLAGAKTGHIFTCEKSGSGMDTKYIFMATPQKAPLRDEIVEKAHDLDAWLESLFEAKDQKALEFIGKMNAAAGLTTTIPAAALAAPAAPQIAAQPGQNNPTPATTAAPAQSNVSPAAVTTAIEPEDAEFEPAPAEDSPFEAEPTTVASPAPPQPAAEPEPTPAPAATPAAAPDQSSEIDAILAGLQ